tara:strand:- start:5131 stop:5463 length:333 start_codon:yes stop_codon:yes gene_type:complete
MADLRDHPDFEEYRKANDLIIASMRESHQVDVDRAERLRRNRDMYKAQTERQAQRLLDQRYKFQRLHKAARDLVELVEWHAYRGEESQRRLSVVKQTLKEFGTEGEVKSK